MNVTSSTRPEWRRLRSAGLPLDRLTLSLRNLHPEIIWRTVAWAPDEPVEIYDREFGLAQSAAFLGSPLRQVMETRRKLVVRVQGRSASWMQADVFRDRNLAEFVIVPLCSKKGPASFAVFATVDAAGFRAAGHILLEDIQPALRIRRFRLGRAN
jgi:adenylate cyclase